MQDLQEEYIMSGGEANLKSLVVIIPLAAVMVFGYGQVWGMEKSAADISYLFFNYKLLIVGLIGGTLAHELLHGLAWLMASGLPWNSMSFGFNWKAVAPYAHCNQPMNVQAYRVGVIVPGLILGILPFVAGIMFGEPLLTSFGFIFTLVAGGDFLILWLLRNVSKSKLVHDHPTQVGCIITDNIESTAKSNEHV